MYFCIVSVFSDPGAGGAGVDPVHPGRQPGGGGGRERPLQPPSPQVDLTSWSQASQVAMLYARYLLGPGSSLVPSPLPPGPWVPFLVLPALSPRPWVPLISSALTSWALNSSYLIRYYLLGPWVPFTSPAITSWALGSS
jgi:hypothetical protein